MMLPPHEGDTDGQKLGGNEELGEWDGIGEAVGVFELLGAIEGECVNNLPPEPIVLTTMSPSKGRRNRTCSPNKDTAFSRVMIVSPDSSVRLYSPLKPSP